MGVIRTVYAVMMDPPIQEKNTSQEWKVKSFVKTIVLLAFPNAHWNIYDFFLIHNNFNLYFILSILRTHFSTININNSTIADVAMDVK